MRHTVLIVDGDPHLRRAVAESSADRGWTILHAATMAEALALVPEAHAVLVDAQLVGDDGPRLCRAVRERQGAVPVILLAGPDTAPGLAEACGATERIDKPLRLGVLLARLRHHLRPPTAEPPCVLGPYTFDPATKNLSDGRRRIRLTEKEAAILRYLDAAGPVAVSRDELLGEVWGFAAGVTTHTLETHIYRLRRKITPDPGQDGVLVTEKGGYRLAWPHAAGA